MPIPAPSEKQARMFWISVTALSAAVFLALIGVLMIGLGWVANRLAPVLLPLAVAAILSYLLDPVVDWVEARFKASRLRAVIIVFVAAGVFFAGLALSIVPQVIRQSNDFIQRFQRDTKKPPATAILAEKPAGPASETKAPDAAVANRAEDQASMVDRVAEWIGNTSLGSSLSEMLSLSEENRATLQKFVVNHLQEILVLMLQKIQTALIKVASLTGFIVGFAMTPVFVFFFLLEEKKIVENWTFYLPVKNPEWKQEIIFILTCINDSLIVFFRGQVLVALCLGFLIAVGFSIIGLNYAILLGVAAAILSIVPYLGVILSIIPALVIAIVQWGDWWHPLLVLMIFVLVQMAEGLVISPKIIGDRVGMHPLTIIIAVLIGTTLMGGIVGGVLAIPLTAALRAILYRYVWKRAPGETTARPEVASSSSS